MKRVTTIDANAYAVHLYVIKLFIALVSKVTDTPSDVVENGIIRGYLRGSDFISDDMVGIMDELLGEDMGRTLQISATDDTATFEQAIEQADIRVESGVYVRLLDELLGSE